MVRGAQYGVAPIYPAFCHHASPTYNKWVKLTALDAHLLRREKGYEGQNILFHLNHPIRHVYLCGPIVAITVPGISGKFVLLTIDDGSGATIDVKITKAAVAVETVALGTHDDEENFTSASERRRKMPKDGAKTHVWELSHPQLDNLRRRCPPLVDTVVDSVKLLSRCKDRDCYEQHVLINGTRIDVGTVIKAKGALSEWKNVRQLDLKRVELMSDTSEEARVWKEYADFCQAVLSKPWVISRSEFKALDERDQEMGRRRRQRAKIQSEHDARKLKKEAKEEMRRQREAKELDGNPLDRPGWKPTSESRAQALLSLLSGSD